MILLVGLGNPSNKYKKNRHNIGFMAIDTIAQSYPFPAFKSKFNGKYSEGIIDGHKIGLLKPETFMNESGISVRSASSFYKLDIDQIIIFHDELDLPASKIKIKTGGGHAGHNGLRSIDAHLGNKNYKRVRMGIGHPREIGITHQDAVSQYVLSDFSKSESVWLEDMLNGTDKYINLLLDDKDNDFMTNMSDYIRG
jgi:PTH1 family peptidyl-tRNA hydrolase